MNKKINIFTSLHKNTKRNYLKRMIDDKVHCMSVAKKYDRRYWDGDRKTGYGGYKYIKDYWKPVANKIISIYELNNSSKILDVGCGKGFLLLEIKKLLPNVEICGFDISNYAIKNSPKLIKEFLKFKNASSRYPFKDNYFDLVISFGCIHNLKIFELEKCLKEIQRVGKNKFIMTESYRNNKELFNLQCWALTCESFFSVNEWKWIFKKFKYSGDYEFIYFE